MRYVYNGFLSERTSGLIESMARSYNYVIEITNLPENWHEWQQTHLKDYPDVAEDCMGQSYSRKTKMYGFVQREAKEPMFLFFKSQEEKTAFVQSFPSEVINEQPFKTHLG
jgi:hypothetical protein